MKRVLAFSLCIVLVISAIGVTSASAVETEPASVSAYQVKQRMNDLVDSLSGKYFNTFLVPDGDEGLNEASLNKLEAQVAALNAEYKGTKSCQKIADEIDTIISSLKEQQIAPNVYITHDTDGLCRYCNISNVRKAAWFKAAIMVPTGTFSNSDFQHYYYGKSLQAGSSCSGFANFAHWYIFSQKSTDRISVSKVYQGAFTYGNLNANAKIGDVLRLGSSTSDYGEHSVILYNFDTSSITVIDCNYYGSTYGGSRITKHTINYSAYDYMTITRADNYFPYKTARYTVTVADGNSLNMRSGPGSSYSLANQVPNGTEVDILKIENSWGKFEYNGIVGWSNLYYMRLSGRYIAEVSFDPGEGSGTMDLTGCSIGNGFFASDDTSVLYGFCKKVSTETDTGFTVPKWCTCYPLETCDCGLPVCPYSKAGCHISGWNLKNVTTGDWLYKSSTNSNLWQTESEAAGAPKSLSKGGARFNFSTGSFKGAKLLLQAQWEPCSYTLAGVKDVTATEDGYTGDMVCSVCGHISEYGTVIPHSGLCSCAVTYDPVSEKAQYSIHLRDYSGSGKIVVACYDDNGKMIDAVIKDISLEADEDGTILIDYIAISEGTVYKLFLLDNNFEPLCETAGSP